jgi:signal transduction histidine kinase/DNA-binding response OmpR family regulator
MPHSISVVEVSYEDDVVTARQRARQVARLLLFEEQDQTRISTAVSEIARLLVHSNKAGRIEFQIEGTTVPQVLLVTIGWTRGELSMSPARAEGNGRRLNPEWEAAIVSARRLMDQCELGTDPVNGRIIRLVKILSGKAPLFSGKALERITKQVGKQEPQNPIEEVRQQNHELLRALEELHERQQELVRVNGELEDTNRGVVALYAELDEKAGHLRRADEMKSRFLSNMSHEFRTPVNAILALSHLLLEHTDGELNSEQARQVGYIRKSGEDLLELVNDLLDLAKIEAGKVSVRVSEFEVGNLFSALRGMLRPLLASNTVNLTVEEPAGIPVMRTDEGKVSQILRNFISNAIKFTQRGEVRVTATLVEDGRSVAFSVADTGIGIAPEDQGRIFEEFSQLDNPIQKQVKGTGLGLPLCRKLAQLLGGSVEVSSQVGIGSTFVATIPVHHVVNEIEQAERIEPAAEAQPEDGRLAVLVVEDEPETRLLYDKYLRNTPFQPIAAGSIRQAREQLRHHAIAAIVLDVMLPDESAWQWLGELKSKESTRNLPVLIVSSVEDPRKGLALGADDYCVKPVRRSWLVDRLERATGMVRDRPQNAAMVLIVDDQETDRYILRHHLEEFGCSIVEATTGEEGLTLARELKPGLILLDLNMPRLDGFEVLGQLQADAQTASLPVVIVTSQMVGSEQMAALGRARAVLLKHELSPAALQRVLADVGLNTVELTTSENEQALLKQSRSNR